MTVPGLDGCQEITDELRIELGLLRESLRKFKELTAVLWQLEAVTQPQLLLAGVVLHET